jgi:hypothetical protein
MWLKLLSVLAAAQVDLLTDLQQSSIAELTDLSAKLSVLSLRYRTVSHLLPPCTKRLND